MAGIATFNFSSPSIIPSSSRSFSPKPSVLPMRVFPGNPCCPRLSKIFALSSNDIKVGVNIEVDGAPWRVLEFLHVKPEKGAAFVRTKLRNYVNGNVVDRTFRAGSSVIDFELPHHGLADCV